MPTFGINIKNPDIHASITQRFKSLKDSMQGDPTDLNVLENLLDMAEGIKVKEQFRDTSKSVQDLLDESDCDFLVYSDGQFQCLELVHRTKKKKELGSLPEEARKMCVACKDGKAIKILEQYRKKLRGQDINELLQLFLHYQKLAETGESTPISFCNRIKGKQRFTGRKTIFCTKINSRVEIDPVCKEPLCEFFEEFIVTVEREFPQETLRLIQRIAEDSKRIEDLSPKKQVEAEQVNPDV